MKITLIAVSSAALLAAGACKKDSEEKPAQPAQKTAAAVPSTPASIDSKPVITLEQVVERHFTALGGADKWRSATSMAYTISGSYDGVDTVNKTVRQRPNMLRVESLKGDDKVVKTWDGKVAAVSKNGKLEVLEGDKAKDLAEWAAFDDVLLDYAKSDKKVALAGLEDVDGTPAHVITIGSEGMTETRYIDSKTYFEVKRVIAWKHGEESGEKVMYFTDYKPVDGLMVNHGLVGEKEGKRHEMKVSDIAFNKQYDADLFRQKKGDS